MPPKLRNSQQKGTQNNNPLAAQGRHSPAVQDEQPNQPEVN